MTMKKISVLVLLLPCWMSYAAAQQAQCNLVGLWKNDLGSNMTISVRSDGVLTGSYLTSVSATTNTILESPLTGFQQLHGSTFGFTIQWAFSDSISVFTGQCFNNEKEQPFLKTIWLLRSASKDAKDDWEQTRVGSNFFYKLPTESPEI